MEIPISDHVMFNLLILIIFCLYAPFHLYPKIKMHKDKKQLSLFGQNRQTLGEA